MQPMIASALPSLSRLDPRAVAACGADGACALEFTIGDITRESTDAVVNPVGPGLVDLAIRRRAGPELLEAFHAAAARLPQQKLSPGQALITPGFDLATRHVIHCAPPAYADDPARARAALAACHVEALRLARAHGLRSIAFPAIATGVYRYPLAEAAAVAVGAVAAELRAQAAPLRVRFVLFTAAARASYAAAAGG
jgi:O-acetyl-ADP-ribose deacetylase (regulator of RNase III)